MFLSVVNNEIMMLNTWSSYCFSYIEQRFELSHCKLHIHFRVMCRTLRRPYIKGHGAKNHPECLAPEMPLLVESAIGLFKSWISLSPLTVAWLIGFFTLSEATTTTQLIRPHKAVRTTPVKLQHHKNLMPIRYLASVTLVHGVESCQSMLKNYNCSVTTFLKRQRLLCRYLRSYAVGRLSTSEFSLAFIDRSRRMTCELQW